MSTTVSYKGDTIATVNNNTKVLETGGTWLEDDITLVDVTSGGGGSTLGTKTITQNGTYNATDDNLDGYSEVTVNVSGGGGASAEDLFAGTFPSGDVSISNVTNTYQCLRGNTAITSFTSDSITQFYSANFLQACSALKTVELTATVSRFQGNMFQSCANLESISIPKLATTFPIYGAAGCAKLKFVDLGKCTQIIGNAFNGDTVLDKIVIRNTSVCSLQNISAFSGTPFASGGSGGTIYVPSSLISSYQTASNWSTLHGYGTVTWAAIEGSEYE